MSRAQVLREARRQNGHGSQIPWKVQKLSDLATLRDLITFRADIPLPLFEGLDLDDEDEPEHPEGVAPAMGAAPQIEAVIPVLQPFEMIFASVDGSSGINFQDSGTLLQDVVFSHDSTQLNILILPDEPTHWVLQREIAQQAEQILSDLVIPDLAAICVAYLQPDKYGLGMWQHLDSLVSAYCVETSFPSRNANPITPEWLEIGYLPLCVPDGKTGAVQLNMRCDNNGHGDVKPCFELRNEAGTVIYRHSDVPNQVRVWDEEDVKFASKHGHVRAPYLTWEASIELLKKSQRVRFLWRYRGFGHFNMRNKVLNFGSFTVVQLLPAAPSL